MNRAQYQRVKDLIDYGRQNPGKMIYGTNAPNSISNLIVEQVANKEKLQTKHIPFKASPEHQTAVLGATSFSNYRNGKELTEYVSRNYDTFGRLLKELGLSK